MMCIRRNNIPNCGCCVPVRDDPGHGEGHAARFERNYKDLHDDCERLMEWLVVEAPGPVDAIPKRYAIHRHILLREP
jgi:hypothetical protein